MGVENKRNIPIKELTALTGFLALLYAISLLSFNPGQKESIKERDRNANGIEGDWSPCLYPGCKNKSQYKVEVHHVIPQGYSFRDQINPRTRAVIRERMMPDTPFNAAGVCEEHHVGYPKDGRRLGGIEWDPIHPDTYFVHLIQVGKFHLLPDWMIKKIQTDFPGLYEYYSQVYKQKQEGKPLDDLYTNVMRKWRSDRLDNRKVYWNTVYDAELQISAIETTISAIRQGWNYPLRVLGGNVKDVNRGSYAWDNLVALSIENYILALTEQQLKKIFNDMRNPKNQSRVVYYEKIYIPAVSLFENRSNMTGMLNHYLNSLIHKEDNTKLKVLLLEVDSARKIEEAYKILYEKIYLPAIKLHKSKMPENKKPRLSGMFKKKK